MTPDASSAWTSTPAGSGGRNPVPFSASPAPKRPPVCTSTLKLDNCSANDETAGLVQATICTGGSWGGGTRVLSHATSTMKTRNDPVKLLSKFTADDRSGVRQLN